MAEAPLQESPLARRPWPHAAGRLAAFERPFLGHINVRGRGEDFAAAVAGVLGSPLPVAANTVAAAGELVACWLGPDEWLVMTPPGREAEVAAKLRTALGTIHSAVTEVGSGQTVIVLQGPAAREVLAMDCPFDVFAPAFAPGACAQTRLAKAAVLLRPVDSDTIELVVRRSFADYLWTWLADAAGGAAP
jgi:sarcosine oxidase subunit gamma